MGFPAAHGLHMNRWSFLLGLTTMGFHAATSGAAPASTPGNSEWEYIWGDEFDREGAPDTNRWAVVVSETFRDRRENVRVENGNLILEVRKDNAEGQKYTSGSVRTADPNSLTYMGTYGNRKYFKPGRIEARIRIAQVRGLMNSFWMISNWFTPGSSYDFYVSGEIDVLEALGYDTDKWYGSSHIHRWFDFPNGRRDRYSVIEHSTIAGLASDYHVWAAEWDESSVRIFCDQRLISTRNKAGDPGERYWPFTSDMALVLELGHKPNPYTDWGSEYGTDDSKLPARMFVDYVRAFRKKT
jgi:beta-glucanase (GH16 family)